MQRFAMTVVTAWVVLIWSANATAAGFNWRDHAAPFDFLFGNQLDTHQQTKLQRDGSLKGLFYVVQLDEDGDGVVDSIEIL